ncbi:hypothetical protein ACHAXA_009850 [Cyclostephanos tholiformis]|uniref:Plastid lipid-associated protein/fibrillin conserved domain-containing protein n=1 Tax=Cyclostephanos tholiformis TaxID=382380 RepID=A0ABD3R707_9STRA
MAAVGQRRPPWSGVLLYIPADTTTYYPWRTRSTIDDDDEEVACGMESSKSSHRGPASSKKEQGRDVKAKRVGNHIVSLAMAVAASTIEGASAFNLPNAFFDIAGIFGLPPPSIASNVPVFANAVTRRLVDEETTRLLMTIADTGNGKYADVETQRRVLSIVRRLETLSPPSSTLLSDIDVARSTLDGDWSLRYTAPGEVDDDDCDDDDGDGDDDGVGGWVDVESSSFGDVESGITMRRFNGAGRVSGGGIPVDASNSVALQSFDVYKSRITNVISTGVGVVTVSGTYRRSDTVPLRAVVAFDTATIALDMGPTLDLSFLFDIRAMFKGTKEAGWLETTYVSDRVRIGRGNKGSLFVLTRDGDA